MSVFCSQGCAKQIGNAFIRLNKSNAPCELALKRLRRHIMNATIVARSYERFRVDLKKVAMFVAAALPYKAHLTLIYAINIAALR